MSSVKFASLIFCSVTLVQRIDGWMSKPSLQVETIWQKMKGWRPSAHDVTYEPHQIRENDRARLVSAKERIFECLVSLMCYVQNLSEFGFAV
jgi:hypothetical protein